MAGILQTTFAEVGKVGRKPIQDSATVNTRAFKSGRIPSKSKYRAWNSNCPGTDKETHSARTYQTILVLVLAAVGGLVGAYGIGARTSSLRAEDSAGVSGKITPKELTFPEPSAFAIPGNYDDKGKMERVLSAETELKDSNLLANITRRNPFISVGGYRELYSTIFEISVPKFQVWAGNVSSRIEKARECTQAKILDGQYIDINLSTQILSIFENGKLLDSYVVSTGKRGMETPRGTHTIANKFPRAWSKKYGMFMPYWMAITPGGSFGIHELPVFSDGYIVGADDLGNPVSHGCVRLGIGPAERVYNWAEVGTPVVVY